MSMKEVEWAPVNSPRSRRVVRAAERAVCRASAALRFRRDPQESAVSPVLANLFMHYAFDMWTPRDYPGVTFERYADDAVVHSVTEPQTRDLVAAIGNRMKQVRLRLHPGKTKAVYCRHGKRRRLDRELTAFTFLGLTCGALTESSRMCWPVSLRSARRQEAARSPMPAPQWNQRNSASTAR
jgi:hypothetical protein